MTTMEWHLDTDTIAAYRADALSPAMAASLEAHVIACAECRALVHAHTDALRATANWAAIADRVDEPRRTVAERVLGRLGARDHVVRLLVLTPVFRVAWFGALAIVSTLAIFSSADNPMLRGDRGSFAFLVLAPIVPLLGIGAAFDRRGDPARELTEASPFSAFELLLIRSTAVLVGSAVITAVASVALPHDASAAVWLLPALGLTTATLALARWFAVTAAAGTLSGMWLLAAAVTARSDAATRLIADYPPFRPGGQLAFLLLAVLAATSAVVTRHSFELRRSM
jgi:hypothetical protein